MEAESFRCWAEIDLSALQHNVQAVRERVGSGVAIMAVIKSNAYGHEVEAVARTLAPSVALFGLANVEEALAVHAVTPSVPLMILGPALEQERPTIVRHRLIPLLSSVEEAWAYAALVRERADAPLPVHLKIDTGMGRMGVWWEEVLETAQAIAAMPELALEGVATHLPSADEDEAWTAEQLTLWERVVVSLRAAGLSLRFVHAMNSAGALAFQRRMDVPSAEMVRAGLVLYGCSPMPDFQARLRPVLTWKSRITLVRSMPAGRGISYGRTFITPVPMRVATVAVGYADGYPRSLSSGGAEVLIGGRRCAVLGRVTMDQIMVDITACPEAAAGYEVVLLGRQGAEEITAAELAAKAGTIAWEILTGLGHRVVRRTVAYRGA
jgi:alanine racemase